MTIALSDFHLQLLRTVDALGRSATTEAVQNRLERDGVPEYQSATAWVFLNKLNANGYLEKGRRANGAARFALTDKGRAALAEAGEK